MKIDFEERIRELMALNPNWDSYGARSIDSKAASAARRLLDTLGPPAELSPLSDGGILIIWHGDVTVETELRPIREVT